MQRRHLLHRAAATATALALLGCGLSATAENSAGPVVGAPKIIEALTSKDVVLDRPGQAARPGAAPRRHPAINLQVQFTFDSAQLLPQGKRQLDELAMALSHRALLGSGFMLAGHTDMVGEAEYNLRLSHSRAEAVKTYLAQAHGVSPQRLQTIGYGFSRLLEPTQPAAAINRRVEVRRLTAGAVGAGSVVTPTSPPAAGRLVPTPR